MTAKQYLRQVRDLDIRTENLKVYYARLVMDVASLKSPRLDGDHVQSSHAGAGFTDAIDRLVDMQAETEEAVKRYSALRDTIISQINSLPYPYCSILFKRYVEYKSFRDIYLEMDYSNPQSVINLHGFALQKFTEKFNSVM